MTRNDNRMPSGARTGEVLRVAERLPPTQIGFLLIDGFAMMSYASVAEPFRAANVLAGRRLYEWQHISTGDAVVRASNGAQLGADAKTGDELALDLLLVCAGGNPAGFNDPATLAWLRYVASRGVRIGGVSGAPYILARASLLDGYRCTIHWEHRPAFIEAFPKLLVQRGLYVIDRDRLTCAGGTAGLDLAIELIAADHGSALATMVGDWYLRTQLRDAGATQRMSLGERYNVNNEKILGALALMEANPEEPLDRALLARQTGVSVRQLERLFADHLGTTIGSSYLDIRLARAMALLKETSLAVMDVAVACGFVSSSHFSRAFKRRYGASPRTLREMSRPDARSI
jgi:transcriptional regulator GlxA family with amidase domain